MKLPGSSLGGDARSWVLDAFRAPLGVLREGLAAADPALALAAGQALVRRVDEGEDGLDELAACVPAELFALSPELIALVANLAVRGVPVGIPALPAELAPALAKPLRCAQLLAAPEMLPLESASALDLAAVKAAPTTRAVASGLWRRAAMHARPAMHDAAIAITRAALEGALVAPEEAQRVLVEIARRSAAAVAARALGLLAEPWASGLPCPALDAFAGGPEVALAAVHVAAARGEVEEIRRAVWSDAGLSVRRAAVAALGVLGAAEDVGALAAAAEEAPAGLGPEVAEALRRLKRRGISAGEEDARALLGLALRCEALPIEAVAESLSSRADALISLLDEHIASGGAKARAVLFLEAFGTRRAIARLVEMAADAGDAALSRFAIRALGRLEERSAEEVIVERLESAPDDCLRALQRIGGPSTARRLRAALEGGEPPVWLGQALAVLLRIDPSPEVLAAAADHEAISSEALGALPAHGSLAQTEVLARIASAPGHPLRDAAIQALGNRGGPAAIEPLGALLTDADEAVRALAVAALKGLGEQLAGPEPPLACLENAGDPGAAMVAEAALRRLRGRDVPAGEVTLLLDAIAGCAHPHLVRVVRPYLRRASPEIKKRAAACLGAAGPACAPWLLPALGDARLPVARQALIAIGRAAVPGLGPTVATWLGHTNMNLKKTAAEALAECRDPQVLAPLVGALAGTDQPGYRTLLEAAIRAVAGRFQRSVLVTALVSAGRTGSTRGVDLLAQALVSAFTPEELAALVAMRPEVPQALLEHAYGTGAGPLAGKLDQLDTALRRRGMAQRIPHEADVAPDSPLRPALARADAARTAATVRRLLRETPFRKELSEELAAAIRAAGDRTFATALGLTVVEQRALAALLPELDAATRGAAIAILANATDRTVLDRVLPHVNVTGELDPRQAPLLKEVIARRGATEARSLARHADLDVQRRAGAVLALAGEDELRRAPPDERPAAIDARLASGREDEIVAAMEGPGALAPGEVARAIAERSGAAAALDILERWAARDTKERAAALVGLAFLGDVLVPRLRAIATGDAPGEVRRDALALLASRRDAEPAFLRQLLNDAHPAVREAAARALLQVGDRDDRTHVLAAWLHGGMRSTFRMPLDEQDAPAVEHAVRSASSMPPNDKETPARSAHHELTNDKETPALSAPHEPSDEQETPARSAPHEPPNEQETPGFKRAPWGAEAEAEQLRLLGPVAALPVERGVGLLHVLRQSPHPRVAAAAREALRRLPESAVLPSVAGALRDGDMSLLSVIGAGGSVSPALARLAGASAEREAWTAFLLRSAGTGALYAGGLGERIAAWAGQNPSPSLLALVARLTDWFDPVRADALVRKLAPALEGARREGALRAVMAALRERPPELLARVLSRVVTPTDTDAVRALAEAEAASPGIVDLLPPPLRAAVVRSLESALAAAGPEAARKLLGYFAARAERPAEREAVLALLERQVAAPSRRVSLHAHRLLRALAPREQYLRATRALLLDRDPGTVRLAVRALAFGGDVESAGAIAERLSHPNAGVARAAREGLLALGERAIVPLERAKSKLRPDRRAPIDALLGEIRSRTGET